jgi:tetraacyldisaccharide 4'-kinase
VAHAHAVWFVSHLRDRAAGPPVDRFFNVNPDLRIVSSVAVPTVLDLSAGGEIPAGSVEGARVLAICGIGRPHRFFETVRSLGPAALETMAFPDHHPFSAEDAADVAAVARNLDADMIVTTAKDHARSAKVLAGAFPYAVLRVSLEIVSGHDVIGDVLALKVPPRRVSPR